MLRSGLSIHTCTLINSTCHGLGGKQQDQKWTEGGSQRPLVYADVWSHCIKMPFQSKSQVTLMLYIKKLLVLAVLYWKLHGSRAAFVEP